MLPQVSSRDIVAGLFSNNFHAIPPSLSQIKKIIFGGKRDKRKQKNEIQTQSSDAGIQQPAKKTGPVPSASSSQQNATELGEGHGATYASNANTDATIPPPKR